MEGLKLITYFNCDFTGSASASIKQDLKSFPLSSTPNYALAQIMENNIAN